ncbi:MAG: CIA30 family protein [Jejuia sp.]
MLSKTLTDFSSDSNENSWIVIDDVVMGGKSFGKFKIEKNLGIFYGAISLENNGGFSSVRFGPDSINVNNYTKIVLHIKGDGKRYKFRLKENINDRHSFVNYFETSGDWEYIEFPLADFYPKFRGKHLEMPNFSGKTIAEFGFLIGNKTAESFQLKIDSVTLK